jgi:AraC-like DNA-binding protein
VVLNPDGEALIDSLGYGVRTWGNAGDSTTVMLTGTYQLDGEVSQRLLRALPSLVVLNPGGASRPRPRAIRPTAQEWDSPIIPLLAEEIVKDEPGQEAVLDRLLDLLLIAVLRAWFARADTGAPDWYRAYSDPVVGHALRLMHHNPAHPWTVATLARETGVSRAALARRFNELVGKPPMTFLTGWRIALAADLLLEGARTGRRGRASGARLATEGAPRSRRRSPRAPRRS